MDVEGQEEDLVEEVGKKKISDIYILFKFVTMDTIVAIIFFLVTVLAV
jgi:hypothetical protein